MEAKINYLREQFERELIVIKDLKSLDELRIRYLGRKGPIVEFGKMMGSFSIDEKKAIGKVLNDLKDFITKEVQSLRIKLEQIMIDEKLAKENIDITLPSTKINVGSIHPLAKMVEKMESFFISMGYDIVDGPEVESDLYNFEMLNLPKGHPARDAHDTFYITDEMLLRTHTSPVQIRAMLANTDKTPIKILCPGKTYRRDNDDALHTHQFMQVEGLVIDYNISLANLKHTFDSFNKYFFGKQVTTRFRPSFYPFTEPSVAMDISCFNCHCKGCSICKETGWITIGGAGMVHPKVLEMSGYDKDLYRGFAFGFGLERQVMIKYGINDIRTFYLNDLRAIKQFDRRGE